MSTKLQPGDWATTDYRSGIRRGVTQTRVQIVARKEGKSQSGVLYQVTPPLPPNAADEWFDAAWFTSDTGGKA